MANREQIETLYEKRVTLSLGEIYTIVLHQKKGPSMPITMEKDMNLANEVEIYVKKGQYMEVSTEIDPIFLTISVKNEIENNDDILILVPTDIDIKVINR